MMVKIYAPDSKHGKVIRHNCVDFPDDPKYAIFKSTTPYIFRDGDEVDLPDDIADYFIRAGWAAEEGKEPIKPDPSKPVFVQPHNANLMNKTTKV